MNGCRLVSPLLASCSELRLPQCAPRHDPFSPDQHVTLVTAAVPLAGGGMVQASWNDGHPLLVWSGSTLMVAARQAQGHVHVLCNLLLFDI